MDRLSVVSLTLYPFTASDPAVIRVTTSVSDHLRNTKRTMVKYVTAASPYFATPAQDAGDAVASFASPSGSLCAVLREVAVEGGDKKRFVEIWKGDTLKAEKEVTKLHGAFYMDGKWFLWISHVFGAIFLTASQKCLLHHPSVLLRLRYYTRKK